MSLRPGTPFRLVTYCHDGDRYKGQRPRFAVVSSVKEELVSFRSARAENRPCLLRLGPVRPDSAEGPASVATTGAGKLSLHPLDLNGLMTGEGLPPSLITPRGSDQRPYDVKSVAARIEVSHLNLCDLSIHTLYSYIYYILPLP